MSTPINDNITKEQINSIKKFLEDKNIPYNLINCNGCEGICINLQNRHAICEKICYNSALVVMTSNKDICKIYPYEIMYITIENRQSVLYLTDGRKIKTNYKISFWNNLLNIKNFSKPHNSFIVNLNYVKTITRDWVYLKYKEQTYSVYTSQRKIRLFRKDFLEFGNQK